MATKFDPLPFSAQRKMHAEMYHVICQKEFPETVVAVNDLLANITQSAIDYCTAAANIPIGNIPLLESLGLFEMVPGTGKVVLVYPLSVKEEQIPSYPGVRYLKFDEKTNVAGDAEQAIARGEILLIPVSDEAKRQLVAKAIPYALLYPCLSLRSDFIVKAVDIDPRHWAVRFFQASWETSLERLRNDSYATHHHVLMKADYTFTELLLGALIK